MAVTVTDCLDLLYEALAVVAPGMGRETVPPSLSLTREARLDSLTITRLSVEVEQVLGVRWPLETWIARQAAEGTDTLQHMAEWLAAGEPTA